ncbi:MAG TPA: ABC transporter permease [Pseudonocardia sp.]|nr:ABC transporter permease [Pseudonocardia sp.]
MTAVADAPVRPARTPPHRRRSARRAVPHLVFLAALLVAWQLAAQLLEPIVLPSVDAVAAAFVDLVLTGELPLALAQSILLLVLGLGIASAVGLGFGILIGRSQVAHWTLSPYFSALFVIPTVALVPIVLIWFGFGMTGRVIIVVLAAVVPILLSVASSLRDEPGELVEVARSFGVRGELALLRTVRLRAAVPVIMSGLRLAVGRAVVGMAVAETYLRLGGIGGLIRDYGSLFQTDYVFAAILPLSLLGVGLSALVGVLERHYQGWRS